MKTNDDNDDDGDDDDDDDDEGVLYISRRVSSPPI